jgi:hypothetical protein
MKGAAISPNSQSPNSATTQLITFVFRLMLQAYHSQSKYIILIPFEKFV